MKPVIFSTLILLLISMTTFSQTQFQKSFGNPNAYDEFYSVCKTLDGGYAFFGNTLNTTTQFDDLLLVKTDSDGNFVWSKTFAFTLDVFGTKIVCDQFGNLVLLGYTFENNPPYDDIFLIKTDPSGNILWSNRYGGTDIDEGNDLAIDNAGDLVIAGYTYSFGTTLKSGFVLKVDTGGFIIWGNAVAQNINQEFNGVSIDNGNNYSLTGLVQVGSGINFDGYVVKLNDAGGLLWGKSVGGIGTETFYHSFDDGSGHLYVSGASSTGTASGNLDGLLATFDNNGPLQSAKTYGTASIDRAYGISPGNSGSNEIVLTGHANNGTGFENNLVLFIDKSTEVLNNYYLTGSSNGSSRAYGMTSDGSSLVEAGFIFSVTDSLGSAYAEKYNYSINPCDFSLANIITATPTFIDSSGTTVTTVFPTTASISFIENSFTPDTVLFCGTIGIDELLAKEFVIYPNPATDKMMVSFESKEDLESVDISIADISGRVIKHINTDQFQLEIDIQDFSQGVYVIGILRNGLMQRKSIVKVNAN